VGSNEASTTGNQRSDHCKLSFRILSEHENALAWKTWVF
jgi:hypothetical protein